MKTNIPRHSSCVGEAWLHGMFKVKFCHPVFDNEMIRLCMEHLFREACKKYNIKIGEIGFDSDHVHMFVELGLRSRPELVKLLKGYTAKKIFKMFPWLKKSKAEGGLFWG